MNRPPQDKWPNEAPAAAFPALDAAQGWFAPTRYLAAINAAGAAISLAVAAYVARVLGPENLGVVGIIGGINGSIAAFVDVRFNDLAGKAFYQVGELPEDRVPAYQAGVLWVAVAGTATLGACTAILSALIGNLVVPVFTKSAVTWWWIPLAALTLAINSVTGTLMFLLRFGRAFRTIGSWRIVSQAVGACLTIAVLTWRPTLTGVYLAAFAGALLSLALMLEASRRVWARQLGLPIAGPDWNAAIPVFRRNLRMILWGNVLGYAKLFQRSTDVLFVAYFTGDRETGLYRLARSLVDSAMAIPQDALYQVYYPSLLELYARDAGRDFRKLAARLLTLAATITLVVLGAEALLLARLVPAVFGAGYAGAEIPMMILSATFVFIVGFHPWLWAFFVASGELAGYTAAVFAATAVQYVTMQALFGALGPSATTAMVGALAYHLSLVPCAVWLMARRRPKLVPGLSPVGDAGP